MKLRILLIISIFLLFLPQLISANGEDGRCVVRDSYTDLPLQYDPDLGTGYAKINVYASDFTDLRTNVCTEDVFISLMESYCTINSNPVQWGVAMGATSGSPIIDGSYHNEYHQCEELEQPEPGVLCTDTDGGKNYYVKGYANNTTEILMCIDGCPFIDFGNPYMLGECYCSGNALLRETYDCPYGCRDGACTDHIITCEELNVSSNYYFNMCKDAGSDKVCFNKFTLMYQGCGRSSYDDCTTYNTNAEENIWCDTGYVGPYSSGFAQVAVISPWDLNSNGQLLTILENRVGTQIKIIKIYADTDSLINFVYPIPGGEIITTGGRSSFIASNFPNLAFGFGTTYRIYVSIEYELTSNPGIMFNSTGILTGSVSEGPTIPTTCSDTDWFGDGSEYHYQRLETKGTCTDNTGAYTDVCLDDNRLQDFYCGPLLHEEKSCLGSTTYYCTGYGFDKCENGACVDVPESCLPEGNNIAYRNKSAIFHVENADVIRIRTSTTNDPYSRCYAAWAKKPDGSYVNLRHGSDCTPTEWKSDPYCSCPTIANSGEMIYYLSDFDLAPYTGDIEFRVSAAPTYCYYWTTEIEVEEQSGCEDTDRGKDFFKKGSVTYNGKLYNDVCVFDVGASTDSLTEYYCAGDIMGAFEYSCLSGCSDGACNIYELYPYKADVDYCIDKNGYYHQTTGDGATARWFGWNGCTKNKYYNVKRGQVLTFRATTDAYSCQYPNFYLYEYIEGSWVQKKYFDLEDGSKLTHHVTYTPTSDKIKIYAPSCFYLKVLSARPFEEKLFTIALAGKKESYAPGEKMYLIAKGLEPDGTPGTYEEGFNLQWYVTKSGQRFSWGNAIYRGGDWYIEDSAPLESGEYDIEIAYYCSREPSDCVARYGSGAQTTEVWKIFVSEETKVCGNGICETNENYCPNDCGWFWVHQKNITEVEYNGVSYRIGALSTCGLNAKVNLTIRYGTVQEDFTNLQLDSQFTLGNGLTLKINGLPCSVDVINIGIVYDKESFVIRGRLIDKYSRKPLANVLINHVNNKDGWHLINKGYTDENGYFEFLDNTYQMGYILQFSPDCYSSAGIVGDKDSSGNYRFYLYDTSEYCNEKKYPIINHIVDLGNVALQPAADIELGLDVPAKFNVYQKSKYCDYDIGGAGNTIRKTEHYMSNILLLNHENMIVLNEGSGDSVRSSYKRIPYQEGCYKVRVDYKNGIFTWSDLIDTEQKDFDLKVTTDKYSYAPGDVVNIIATLSGDSSINFNDAVIEVRVTDPTGKIEILQGSAVGAAASGCAKSPTSDSYTCTVTNMYSFIARYPLTSDAISGLYNVYVKAMLREVTITAAIKTARARFEVNEFFTDYVDITISPKEQSTIVGRPVSYEVLVKDRHPIPRCGTSVAKCDINTIYNYNIDVHNLPYNSIYPSTVSVPAGGSKSFEIKVYPSPIRTQEGVATAVEKTEVKVLENERATASTGAYLATGYPTAVQVLQQAIPIKVAAFRFTVDATLDQDPTVRDSDTAVLYVKYSHTPEPPDFPEEETITVYLKRGWNLFNLPGEGTSFVEGTCSLERRPFAFVYLHDQRRFISIEEAAITMGLDRLFEYLSTHSFWAYSYENCEIGVRVNKYSTYSGLSLVKGWNMIGTTRDMVGETMNSIKGTCIFEKIYTWDSDSQEWVKRSGDDLIETISHGIAVKTLSPCNLKPNSIQPALVP